MNKKETAEIQKRLREVEQKIDAICENLGIELTFHPNIYSLFFHAKTRDYVASSRPGGISLRDDLKAQIAPILKHLRLDMVRKEAANVPIHYEVKKKEQGK